MFEAATQGTDVTGEMHVGFNLSKVNLDLAKQAAHERARMSTVCSLTITSMFSMIRGHAPLSLHLMKN